MNAKIRKIQPYSQSRSQKARVFVYSNATKIADDWFNENEVWSLKFKSKTWQKMGRLLHKINRPVIAEQLKCDVKDVKYSVYCGCSCPCSPGYNAFNVDYSLCGKGVWMDIEASKEDLKPLTDYIKLADLELQVEIAEN